jgi:endonuclease-3
LNRLEGEYPKAKKTALAFSTPLELLVAAILSARTTDEQVNEVTPELFKRYKTANDYANADLKDLEEIIHPTGFFHQKAKWIKESAKTLVKEYDSMVPQSMEELITLTGVARKTANVVLHNAFEISEGITVDTHVMRLAQRLGFSKKKQREKIEQDLMDLFPKEQWSQVGTLLIAHGRQICEARNPKCSECVINDFCPSAFSFEN